MHYLLSKPIERMLILKETISLGYNNLHRELNMAFTVTVVKIRINAGWYSKEKQHSAY